METLILIIDTVLAVALVLVVLSGRKLRRREPRSGFKTNIIIESALSLEL